MKRLQLLSIFLILCALSFGQNQSITGVQPFISNPIGPQFGGQEIFRFQPGLVTQLGAGSTGFDFNQKWFSIGELNTGSQMVYGLRFQLPNKSLTMGYQNTNDINPRIQWIGTGQSLGDLEFRVANSFTSTSSDFVASFNRDGTINIGGFNTQLLGQAQVKINSNLSTGLSIRLQDSSSNTDFGVYSDVNGANQTGFGFFGYVTNSQSANIGVAGRNSGTSPIEYAIYGVGEPFGGQTQNNWAGFFDGDLSFTADFFNHPMII